MPAIAVTTMQWMTTPAEAMETARGSAPVLVLLDIGLPDGSGLDVARELRRQSQVPIIMLTARGSEADRVAGLELGADDYIVKPFSAREVIARVRAVLRRSSSGPAVNGSEQTGIGDLTLATAKNEAKLRAAPPGL